MSVGRLVVEPGSTVVDFATLSTSRSDASTAASTLDFEISK